MNRLTIATRGSKLALWQAKHIKARLEAQYPNLDVKLLTIKTKGDNITDVPLSKIGGKGLFVKEIEEALLSKKADIAVHSMKDVPMLLPKGLILGAIPEREILSDLFLSKNYRDLDHLPIEATLGTSSLRRQAQVLSLRPDLKITFLRGNVETRLRKMMEGEYDAIILASAGIKRLGLSAPYEMELCPPKFLPAVGQGALGIEIREDDTKIAEYISFLNHEETRICVEAERAFLATLDGGCQVPIAGIAIKDGDNLRLEGLVAEPNASQIIRKTLHGTVENRIELAQKLAHELLNAGAKEILDRLYS